MGIDFLDIVFRLEKEFHCKFERGSFEEHFRAKVKENYSRNMDIKFIWLVEIVEIRVREKNPAECRDVYNRVRKIVSQVSLVDEMNIHDDSYMVKDLGLE